MNHEALKQYSRCWFIRAFEAAIAAESAVGRVPGLVHLSTGSEVADILLAHRLDWRRDRVAGSHRSHGLALACGTDALAVAREILGKAGGLSNGLAGTQHLIATEGETSFLTSNGIVGGQVPLAAGAALSAKARPGMGGIGVAVFGDGAVNQGAVLETMNLAVALALPMLFVLYNNGMAQTTPVGASTAGDYCARARSFGLAAQSVDSADYSGCSEALQSAVTHARFDGPAFIEIGVTRDHGHYFGDHGDGDEFEASAALLAFGDWLREQGATDQMLRVARRNGTDKAKEIVAEAVATADSGASAENWVADARPIDA